MSLEATKYFNSKLFNVSSISFSLQIIIVFKCCCSTKPFIKPNNSATLILVRSKSSKIKTVFSSIAILSFTIVIASCTELTFTPFLSR